MFATIWLAGSVVFVMNTGSADNCQDMKKTITADIAYTYETVPGFGVIDGKKYQQSDWQVTCEKKALEIGELK